MGAERGHKEPSSAPHPRGSVASPPHTDSMLHSPGPRKEALARSFPGDYPCSSTSPRGQVLVRCELLPPVQPRVPALEGRSDELQPPSPGGLRGTPAQRPAPPLSSSVPSFWDPVPPGLPAFLSSPQGVPVPQMPEQPGTETPPLQTHSSPSLCAFPISSPLFPEPSSLSLAPDLPTPLSLLLPPGLPLGS